MRNVAIQRSVMISVGLVMAAVTIIGGYRLFPRADSRFVGKWTMASREAEDDPLVPWGTIEFRANGTAVMDPGTSGHTVPFPWQSRANSLTFGEKPRRGPMWFHDLIDELRSLSSGSACYCWDEATFKVEVLEPDRMVLTEVGFSAPFILTRDAE